LNPLPPPNKIPGYATGTESDFTRTFAPWIGGNQASEVPVFWLIIDGNLEEKIHSLYYIYLYISPFCLSSTEFVGTPPPLTNKIPGYATVSAGTSCPPSTSATSYAVRLRSRMAVSFPDVHISLLRSVVFEAEAQRQFGIYLDEGWCCSKQQAVRFSSLYISNYSLLNYSN